MYRDENSAKEFWLLMRNGKLLNFTENVKTASGNYKSFCCFM